METNFYKLPIVSWIFFTELNFMNLEFLMVNTQIKISCHCWGYENGYVPENKVLWVSWKENKSALRPLTFRELRTKLLNAPWGRMNFQRIMARIWLIKWKQVLNKEENFRLVSQGDWLLRKEKYGMCNSLRKKEDKRMIDGKGPWVSISLKIKWEVRDVSPIGLPLSHLLFLCTDFLQRDN